MFALLLPALLSIGHALQPSVTELSSQLDSVVQIRNDAPDQNGDDAPAFCVATLLSPSTLITAAHCVKDLYFHSNLTLQVDLGHYRYITRPTGERVRIGYVNTIRHASTVQIRFLPALGRKLASSGKRAKIGPNEDVAVVHLRRALELPSDFIFTRLPSATQLQAMLKAPLNFSPTVTTINFLEESSLDYKRSALLNDVKVSGQHFTSKSTSRVAPGDSGAPFFMSANGRRFLVAVVKGRAETIFSNWDVYSHVHQLACVEERLPACQ